MKVLFLLENAGGGGAESFVSTLAGEYVKRGHSCVLCCSRDGWLSDALESSGIETVKTGLGRKDFFSSASELSDLCREKGIGIIHAQFPRENVLAVRAAQRCPGVKVVYTDHMSIPQGIKWRMLNRYYCKRNEFVAAVWEGGRSVLIGNGVPKDKIRVIPNGVRQVFPEGTEFSSVACTKADAAGRLRKRYGIPEESFVLCSLMRLSSEKGPDVLLEALAGLKHGKQFCCIIGGGGPMERTLFERAEKLGVSGQVIFAGRIDGDEKKDLLLGSDLYVSSSRSEAMSMAVLEAMACALPQVLTRTGAAEELGCGVLVPPGDPKALAEALKNTIEDVELRRRLSELSLRTVSRQYSAERMADLYLSGGRDDR